MKLPVVFVLMMILSLASISLRDFAFSSIRLEKKVIQTHRSYSEKKFIAESFKNTCRGKGFSSFEEWQKCCRRMFSLEYIAWCPAREFMIDEAARAELLIYATWIASKEYSGVSGEIYCRLDKGVHIEK